MNAKNTATTKIPTVLNAPVAAPNTWHTKWVHFDRVTSAVPPHKVRVCRADLRVVRSNVRFAMANLGVTRETIASELPAVPVAEIFELGELANALVYSSTRVVKAASDGEIATRIERVSPLRTRVLAIAEVLAQMGYFDVDVVARIRSGSGLYDMAEDCVALAGLFEEHWTAIQGTHPFTRANLETLRVDGEWLLDRVTPTGARRQTPREDNSARDSRDRMWTVLVERYDCLRRVAYYFHGDQFENFVPKLQSSLGRSADEGDLSDDASTKDTHTGKPVDVPTKPIAQPAPLTH